MQESRFLAVTRINTNPGELQALLPGIINDLKGKLGLRVSSQPKFPPCSQVKFPPPGARREEECTKRMDGF
jgi:hypothetical protein